MNEVVDGLFSQCQLNLTYLSKLESVPRTLNHHYLSSTSDILYRKFKLARLPPRTAAKSEPGAESDEDEDEEDNQAMDQDIEYNEEINIMSQVQAYWKVGYKVRPTSHSDP